ncbi:MAG TPA: S8 family serine peptidase [Nitrosopumilaceae archaeon]|nr:S8 family serine peptidase [Nitrosopumilaceae archaeon]
MKHYKFVFFSFAVILCITFILSNVKDQEKIEFYLEKNTSLIGVGIPREQGFEGQGIKIGIIDTGIDYDHPDLLGFGPSGKVVGGYNFVDNNNKPIDITGHGTEVAGIIAADGNLKGVAPKAKLFSYKVSSTGESVSSDLIVKAIHRAIKDKVNVINISLGVNKTNGEIDQAVSEAVKNGIIVVVAAGNNGPDDGTIGSPGKDPDAITVGATYNNITQSIVSTLEIGKTQYQVLPMLGTNPLSKPITGKIVFGGYGRIRDLANGDAKDSILLEERGSDIKGEKIYFSEKERNAAQSGAQALIVFNNEPGIFFGEIYQPNSTSSNNPTIPVISMSKSDGLALKKLLQNETIAKLDVFSHPDFVAPFSSRGPVSPFYIKPDLVAPGVFVNSTHIGGTYNLTSGTSIAAPHVTGAVALLLQKDPNLKPDDVASLLSTTTDPVTDAYGNNEPVDVTGSGRLNLTKAFSANLIIIPHSLVFNLALEKPYQTRTLHLQTIQGILPNIQTKFASNQNDLKLESSLKNNSLNIKILMQKNMTGDFYRMLEINDGTITYHVPIMIHVTKGKINTSESDGILTFDLDHPGIWSYAKISVIKEDTDQIQSASLVPHQTTSLSVYEPGKYWIEAQITTPDGIDNAYDDVIVEKPAVKTGIEFLKSFGIPIKEIIIISGVIIAAITVVLVVRRN